MNLSTLKTTLQTVTGTDIGQVLFDLYTVMNETRDKTYPVVFWDMGTAKITENAAKPEAVFEIEVYAADTIDPDSDNRMTKWNSLRTKVQAYFEKMNEGSAVYIDTRNMVLSMYEYGIVSPDLEIAIKYVVTMKVYC